MHLNIRVCFNEQLRMLNQKTLPGLLTHNHYWLCRLNDKRLREFPGRSIVGANGRLSGVNIEAWTLPGVASSRKS